MITEYINDHACRSILCLNGSLPVADFFSTVSLPLIAADGAANQLADYGMVPRIIIGDLDSLRPELRNCQGVLYRPEQDSSDFQKALVYMRQEDLLPTIITGINGGFLDHILNNINIFMDTESLLYAPPVIAMVLREGRQYRFTPPVYSKVSLLGIPEARISSSGLKWELNRYRLTFPGTTSCFNRSADSEIMLHVHQGSILMMLYETHIADAGSKL